MKGDRQGAILSAADSDATAKRRLAISFWNFGLLSVGPNSVFNDLELCIAEAVERGFNCLRA